MKLNFSPNALNTFQQVKSLDPARAERIKTILKDAVLHPEYGIGEPVALDGKYKGLWQRKISFNEFLYYVFDEESLTVASIKIVNEATTLDKPSTFEMGEFSEDDYASVMALMAANRGKDSEPKVGSSGIIAQTILCLVLCLID